MRDIQVSRPLLIALVGAIVVGGVLFFKSQSSSEAPAPPVTAQAAPTGATAAATPATGDAKKSSGATGATAATQSAEERRVARRNRLIAMAKDAGMPLPVFTALRDNKAVLIFFANKKGQTDQHVNQSINEVKDLHGSKLVVIKENINDRPRYNGIAKVTEITQTPGIVMLYGAKADSVQGYIDGGALNSRLGRLLDEG